MLRGTYRTMPQDVKTALCDSLWRNQSWEKIKSELDTRGVAVVPGVIPHGDCDKYIAEYKQWLRKFEDSFPYNWDSLITKYNVSHMSANWAIRLQAKPVFAKLWGTTKLLSSFDAIAIGRPPETSETKFLENDSYDLHLDQGANKIGLHAYQGAIYLEDAAESDWCFTVMEASHLHHTEFYKLFKDEKPDGDEFRRLSKITTNWYLQKGCLIKRISCPKGGMILWDSRTVHAGAPPLYGRRNSNRWRFVAFVCMAPAVWANREDLKTKAAGFNGLMTSFHWPAHGADHFPKTTDWDEKLNAVNELPSIARTEEVHKLVGVLSYNFQDESSNGPVWTPVMRCDT